MSLNTIMIGWVLLGMLYILISSLCFVLSSFFGKIVAIKTEMTPIIASFSRFSMGAIALLIFMIYKKETFKPNNKNAIIARAVTNSFAIILMTWSLQYTTVTNTNMLNMTYPVYVALFAPIIIGEKSPKSTYFYIINIMLASYIVSNPSFGNVNKGDVIALASAIAAGISVVYLRKARLYDSSHIIVFYVMSIGVFINLPFVVSDFRYFNLAYLKPIFLAGFFGFMGQLFLTMGYKHVDSTTGAIISTSSIVMAAIVGYIFLSEPISLRIIIGITIIVFSIIGISGGIKKIFKGGLIN